MPEVDNLPKNLPSLSLVCAWHASYLKRIGIHFIPLDLPSSLRLSYEMKPFNFFVFCRKFQASEPVFLCQSSSLEFLAKHKFDFNRWVYEGVTYVSKAQIARARKALQDRDAHLSEQTKVTASPEDAQKISELMYSHSFRSWIRATVAKWLEESSESTLILPPANPYIRRLTYEAIADTFPNIYAQGHHDTIKLTKVANEDEKKQAKAKDMEERLVCQWYSFLLKRLKLKKLQDCLESSTYWSSIKSHWLVTIACSIFSIFMRNSWSLFPSN